MTNPIVSETHVTVNGITVNVRREEKPTFVNSDQKTITINLATPYASATVRHYFSPYKDGWIDQITVASFMDEEPAHISHLIAVATEAQRQYAALAATAAPAPALTPADAAHFAAAADERDAIALGATGDDFLGVGKRVEHTEQAWIGTIHHIGAFNANNIKWAWVDLDGGARVKDLVSCWRTLPALTAPAEPDRRRIVLDALAQYTRVNYANLTATLQAAADELVAEGLIARNGDYLDTPAGRAALHADEAR